MYCLSPLLVMFVIILIYLFLGCIMDSLSMLLLTIPIFFPIGIGPFLLSDLLRITLIVFVPSVALIALKL